MGWIRAIMRRFIDPECTSVVTAKGTMTLMGLFIPMFIEQLLMNMTGTVNTLMLSHYADDAVAAVGSANQMIGFVFTFYAVFGAGASIVISNKLGAQKEKEASDAAFSAIVCGGIVSVIVSVILSVLAVPIMGLMQLEDGVMEMAVTYFKILIRWSFLQGVMSAVLAVLRSYGKAKLSVTVSLLMNFVNAVLNYFVIFQPFPLPYEGVQGIAVASVISRVIALVVAIYYLATSGLQLKFREKRLRTLTCMFGILRVGMPSGVSSLSYSLSQVVSTSILAVLGTAALTAKVYVSSIVFYVYVVGMSMGLATSLMMGWMKGAGEYEKAYRLNQQVLRLAVLLNVVLSVVIFIFHRPLMGLFTESEEIIQMTGVIFLIDIVVEIGRAFNHVEDNSLKGAGDVLFPMIIAIASCWAISICFSYLFGIVCGFGLAGCWVAFMLDELFRGGIFWLRFRSRKWEKMRL